MRNFKPKSCVLCSSMYIPTTGKQKACQICAQIYFNMRHAEQCKRRSRERKTMGVEYLGGICVDCKTVYPPYMYDFHHLIESEKERDPAQAVQMSWENFKKELNKCVLLCANCHRERHCGV